MAMSLRTEEISTPLDLLTADPEVEAVVIATPAETHLGFVEAALGAGKRRDNGLFVGLGEVGCFACTSAPINEEIYWGMYVYLTNTNTVLQYHGDQKNMAFSVRCLKD